MRSTPASPALLADLHARGCQLVLATSKPEEYARRIMEHFDLAQYFTAICGATLDEPAPTRPRSSLTR